MRNKVARLRQGRKLTDCIDNYTHMRVDKHSLSFENAVSFFILIVYIRQRVYFCQISQNKKGLPTKKSFHLYGLFTQSDVLTSTAAAAFVLFAAQQKDNDSDKDYPNGAVVKQIAKTIHR